MSVIILVVLGLHIGAGWLYWLAVAVYSIYHGVMRIWDLGMLISNQEEGRKK